MLVELWCEEFKTGNTPLEPIRFHEGLNAVLGDDNGSNSIGKSTFLMILDFVFGGKDYVKKCTDVHTEVSEHAIHFAFLFRGRKYCFSRSNVEYTYVVRCDEKYNPLPQNSKISLIEYGKFLSAMYGLEISGLTWRSAVSRFIRVYKRETLDEERPLRSAKDEKGSATVKNYMLLYDRYAAVQEQTEQAAQAEDERDAFKKAQQYETIRISRSQKEYEENEAYIRDLEEEERKLAEQNNEGLLDLDGVQAGRLSELSEQLITYRRQVAMVRTRLNDVRKEMTSGKKSFKRTYNDLEHFFPGVEFKSLEEIEAFHQKLYRVLAHEYKEAEKTLATTFVMLNNEIVRIEEEIKELKNIPNVSEAILREYARIASELYNLRDANKNFKKLEELKKRAAEYARTRDEVIKAQLSAIETMLNSTMRDISVRILKNERHMSPILRMDSLSKYSFNTPNDGGTGAQFRGVITFDIANMELSNIPFIVHDSVVLKHVEKRVLAEIMKVYEEQHASGKQVFIAFDMLDSYDSDTQNLLREKCVLELAPGGNELFGRAWNIERDDEDHE